MNARTINQNGNISQQFKYHMLIIQITNHVAN
jgi:hypothetical protein